MTALSAVDRHDPANRFEERLKSARVGLVLHPARVRGFYETSLEPALDSTQPS